MVVPLYNSSVAGNLPGIVRCGNVAVFFFYNCNEPPGSQAQFKLISSFNLHFSHKLIAIRSILCLVLFLYIHTRLRWVKKYFFFFWVPP